MKKRKLGTFFHACLFVLGFSSVFIIGWGGAATALGQLFNTYKEWVGRIGGVIVVALGLFNMGIINLPWLNYEKRGYWKPGRGGSLVSALMMGILFAAGWTPCIGVTLGAILTLGLSQESSFQAMILSAGYTLGLAVPFLVLGIGTEKAVLFFARFKNQVRTIEIVSGVLIVLVGILMIFNQMTLITLWAIKNGFYLDIPLGQATLPTLLVSFTAGLLSFFSPCVLPLIPAFLGFLSSQSIRSIETGNAE